MRSLVVLVIALAALGLPFEASAQTAPVQWSGFAGDAQHTAVSRVASQSLDRIRWQTPVDLQPQDSGGALLIHYGSPVVTAGNTVIVPVKVTRVGLYRVEGHNGSDGTMLWKLPSDYLLPPHNWTPSFNPALTPANRLYFPGAGGTLLYRDQPDAATGPTGRVAFYGLSNFEARPVAYTRSVMINTPLTSDSAGNVYFGFQVVGSAPLNLKSGIARVAPDGTGTWIAASDAASDATMKKVVHNAAPALSRDGGALYVAVNNSDGTSGGPGYLLKLDSQTLAPIARVRLKDPKSGADASLSDNGTASPTVGPDGDVYYGVLENPGGSNNSRGWLLHFDTTLAQTRIPGAFGWDDTASIVPVAAVPSYTGQSAYLLMTKYNNYANGGGDGVNKIAVLDPNTSMTDPVSNATVMNEVLTIVGPTPDPSRSHPDAVREWCINTAVVDPAAKSVLVNSEDGKLYRWDLTTNTFTQTVDLTEGIFEAYTPTLIGADGTVYAINNAILFAVGL